MTLDGYHMAPENLWNDPTGIRTRVLTRLQRHPYYSETLNIFFTSGGGTTKIRECHFVTKICRLPPNVGGKPQPTAFRGLSARPRG